MNITSRSVGRLNAAAVKDIYLRSFPDEERLPWWVLRLLSMKREVDFVAYYDGDELCGFTYGATVGNIIFIMFLAVKEDARGRGYGSGILQYIKSTSPEKSIMLNVEMLDTDAPNYAERVKRLEFYAKNGFTDTGHNIDEVGGTFRILSTAGEFDRDGYMRVFEAISFGLWHPRIVRVIIETDRLILREYSQSDFRSLRDIICDAETMKYYPKPYDERGVQRWLDWCIGSYRDRGFGLWAIELKSTGEFIGDCGISLQSIDGETLPEIGYHINKRFWRRGFAKEAARAVRTWCFENTDFDCIYSYMNKYNEASAATARANGMRLVKEYEDSDEQLSVYAVSRDEV